MFNRIHQKSSKKNPSKIFPQILEEWEGFDLAPQWVKLYGGTYNTKPAGEVLVGEVPTVRNQRERFW
jgi:hypothetical protein